MIEKYAGQVALLWRGDRQARREATPETTVQPRLRGAGRARHSRRTRSLCRRYGRRSARAAPEARRRARLGQSDFRRAEPHALDAMLRDVASRGLWVSAHPDVILKMGVKEVLHRTKHLGWGTDTHLYRDRPRLSAKRSRRGFCRRALVSSSRTAAMAARASGRSSCCLDCIRGARLVRVLQARRGSVPEDMPLGDFMRRCEAYFAAGGCIIDQPFQPRLPDGMIRCYMGSGQGRRLRTPADQGADSAAARGPGLPSRATGSAHHAPCVEQRHFRRSGRRWNRSGRRR